MKIMTWKLLLAIMTLIVVNAAPLMACPLTDIDSAKQHLADGDYGRSVAVLAACIQDNESQAEAHFLFLLDKANNAPDKRSAPLYELAIAYCGETCGLIKQAGIRLAAIVDRIEKTNPLDSRIVRYTTIASRITDLPPQIKTYTPGIYPFKLAKGDWTHWIRCDDPAEREYEFRSDNQQYEVLLRNGKKYRAWAGDRLPETIDSDIRIKASEDTVIFLTIR